jgi:two-component system sensor histidine kinase PilS (NtrC family)
MLPAGSGDEPRDLMQIVVREGQRLDGLITELLSYASPRPLLRTRVELAPAISQMLQVFEHDKRLGPVRIEVAQADLAYVEIDLNRLRQVMWNLLRNAAEANPGGTIEIRILCDKDHGQAHILVRDHGPGVSEETRQHLFEPFFTTKETGTGLGLATVHRIVEEHGGQVDLHNVPEGGAECAVALPLCPEPSGERPALTRNG